MKRLALVLALCLSGAASAGPLSDLIMAEGVFADAGAGDVLHYSLSRNGPGDAAPALSALRLLVMEDNGTKFLLLDKEAGGTRSEIARFPAASANPLLLYFLENIVPAKPGHLLSLKADTGAGAGGYSEEMILIGGE